MNRIIIQSSAFARDLRRWLKMHPASAAMIETTIDQLSVDAYHPSLSSHKLHGKHAGCWACSAGYDL